MSLAVFRDPAKRMGGSALITLPDGPGETVQIVVTMDGGAATLGPHGWQGSDHAFGPYPVEKGPRGQFVRVGPEIVDQLEAFDPIEIAVPDRSAKVALPWPSDILPSPDRATGGGVQVVGAKPSNDQSAKPRPAPEPPPQEAAASPAPETTVAPAAKPEPEAKAEVKTEGKPVVKPEPTEKPKPPWSKLIVPVALVLAVIVGAVLFFTQKDSDPPPPAPTAECTRDRLQTVLRDPAATAATLQPLLGACQSAGNHDLEVTVLERLIRLGDAAALLRLAEWYDPSRTSGSSPFAADPQVAAGYYKRAAEAGASNAAAGLSRLCTTLRGRPDQPAKLIVEIYCQ